MRRRGPSSINGSPGRAPKNPRDLRPLGARKPLVSRYVTAARPDHRRRATRVQSAAGVSPQTRTLREPFSVSYFHALHQSPALRLSPADETEMLWSWHAGGGVAARTARWRSRF